MSLKRAQYRFYLTFHTLLSRRPCVNSLASNIRRNSRGIHDDQTISRPRKTANVPHTHYDFFPHTLANGPPPSGTFHVDLSRLRKEFYQLQANSHPDRFPADQKNRAEGLSARINEAYKTLQDPLRRAQYILQLRGVDVAEDETAKVRDPELLMEVLEVRESIEAVENEDQLLPLKQQNDEKIANSIAVLDQAFKQDDMASAEEESIRLRYWTNIRDSIDAWESGKPVVMVH